VVVILVVILFILSAFGILGSMSGSELEIDLSATFQQEPGEHLTLGGLPASDEAPEDARMSKEMNMSRR